MGNFDSVRENSTAEEASFVFHMAGAFLTFSDWATWMIKIHDTFIMLMILFFKFQVIFVIFLFKVLKQIHIKKFIAGKKA